MTQRKSSHNVPDAKPVVEILNDREDVIRSYRANSQAEAQAMVFAFREAFNLCGSTLDASLKGKNR